MLDSSEHDYDNYFYIWYVKIMNFTLGIKNSSVLRLKLAILPREPLITK